MSNIPEDAIRRAQERAERRGREWLEREEQEMERQMEFAKQVLSVVVPTEQDLVQDAYEKKIIQILEAQLQVLAEAR